MRNRVYILTLYTCLLISGTMHAYKETWIDSAHKHSGTICIAGSCIAGTTMITQRIIQNKIAFLHKKITFAKDHIKSIKHAEKFTRMTKVNEDMKRMEFLKNMCTLASFIKYTATCAALITLGMWTSKTIIDQREHNPFDGVVGDDYEVPNKGGTVIKYTED